MSPPPLDSVLAALADPTRRAVVELLRNKRHRASELADAMAMSRPAMSRHLRVLRKSGLIALEHDDDDARARIYRLRPEPLRALRSWIDDVEAFWSAELASFKTHAERTRRRSPR